VTRLDAALFGEAQSRILVAAPVARREELLAIARGLSVPFAFVGRAGGDRLRLWSLDVSLTELRDAYEGGLERALAG
jgi:phosphoribosylformylglycinamidine synthase